MSPFFLPSFILLFLVSISWADDSLLKLNTPWTGDFDGMAERNEIRVLLPYSKTHYFLDQGHQRGATYEGMKIFEKWLNEKQKRKKIKIRMIVVPTPRDKLFSSLVEGKGDMAAGNLTITPERLETIDFSDPFATGVREIVITGPDSPDIQKLDDLSGREIFVRKSSSYFESLSNLNARFKKDKKKPVKLEPVDDLLEDEDLLEMVDAGLIPMVVVDAHKARLWSQVFEKIVLHDDIALRADGEIAWAFRKNSPKLKEIVNLFVKEHKQGSLLFNIVTKRYLKDTKWVKNSVSESEIEKFNQTVEFFRKYSGQYDFDWLMVAALAYQESGLDQSKRSGQGAVGVMQILPSTAKDPNVDISDIHKLENNIHAGVKYLRFLRDRYFEKEPMDNTNKTLFTFASYNAGPARIAGLREEAEKADLDPDTWFRNVEIVAARRIGRETVQYVANIYKYYTAYRLLMEKKADKESALEKIKND